MVSSCLCEAELGGDRQRVRGLPQSPQRSGCYFQSPAAEDLSKSIHLSLARCLSLLTLASGVLALKMVLPGAAWLPAPREGAAGTFWNLPEPTGGSPHRAPQPMPGALHLAQP